MTFKRIGEYIRDKEGNICENSFNNLRIKNISFSQKKILNFAEIISNEDSEEIGFVCRSMVNASMPHSRVNDLHYKRKNNNFTLSIVGSEEAGGVPYGTYPRLIMSWLASEVVKNKSREIVLGESLSDFMKNLGLLVTGGRWGTISRFREQLKRLFAAVITISYEEKEGGWLHSTMNIADKALIYWNANCPSQIDLFKSKVILGETFFEEIMKAPIPVDIRAINALKDSSLALDIYFWLTYRMSYLRKNVLLPFEKLHLQFGSGYADTAHGRYEFKRKFIIQLRKVLTLYPKAKLSILKEGLLLMPSPSHVKKKNLPLLDNI